VAVEWCGPIRGYAAEHQSGWAGQFVYNARFPGQLYDQIAFYGSPAGIALLQKMPIITRKSIQLTQPMMVQAPGKMNEAMHKLVDEIHASK
jgi:hypothetical protein